MKIGLSACSNGHLPEWEGQITELMGALRNIGIEAVPAQHIMRTVDDFSGMHDTLISSHEG